MGRGAWQAIVHWATKSQTQLTQDMHSLFLDWYLNCCCCSPLSHVWLFAAPWIAAHQASLSFTISWNLIKLVFTESEMPPNHLILCCPLLLLPSIFPSIRVFSKELALHIRWPKYWSFSFSPSNEYSGLISLSIDWFDLLTVQATLESSNTTVWKHQFFSAQSSLWSSSHICIWLLENP